MRIDDAMKALERAGTDTMRRTYLRHGAKAPVFGVPYAQLYALQKEIGTDQALAEALWATGNHDARTLATLVADGAAISAATLDRWRRDCEHRLGAMAFASLAARSAPGLQCAERWIDGKGEFEQAAGWGTLAGLANARAVPDDVFAPLLGRLERTIHQLPNLARYMANNCLIAIAMRPSLAAAAMRAAKAVGRVEVDHGDTACKTPLASEYIAKLAARAAAKGRPKAAKPAASPTADTKTKTQTKTKAKAAAKAKRRTAGAAPERGGRPPAAARRGRRTGGSR
jgi:hypothetical protein